LGGDASPRVLSLEKGEKEHANCTACEFIPFAQPAREPQESQTPDARRASALLGEGTRRCAKKCWRRTHGKEEKAP
jgi:hypothetical protein